MEKGSARAVFWVKMCVIILLSGDSASMLAFSPSLVHPPAIQNTWSAAKRPRLMKPFPRPCLSMTENSGGLSDADIAGLLARVSATKGRVATIPICILDATLPRQRLEFAADDPSFSALLQYCKEMAGGEGLGKLGMLGVDRTNRCLMRHGTEVDIVKADPQSDGSVAIELVGTRRFQLVGDPWSSEPEEPVPAPLAQVAGATQGTSKFILSRVEYASDDDSAGWPETSEGLSKESQRLLEDLVDEVDNEANLQQSKELDGLVDTWCDLVVQRGFERQPGQVARIIMYRNITGDLGDIPPADKAYSRAIWVAALINPLPALGVAFEVRPAILQATSTAEALEVVLKGIRSSINHVNGTKPLF